MTFKDWFDEVGCHTHPGNQDYLDYEHYAELLQNAYNEGKIEGIKIGLREARKSEQIGVNK